MLFTRIPRIKLDKLYHAVEGAEKVKGRISAIVKQLGIEFDSQSRTGLSLTSHSDWPVCALIESPLGRGRLRVEWTVLESGVAGLVIVDREVLTSFNQLEYQPVWAFTVPEYGDAYIGSGQERESLRIHALTSGQVIGTAYELGMSILYKIAAGCREDEDVG